MSGSIKMSLALLLPFAVLVAVMFFWPDPRGEHEGFLSLHSGTKLAGTPNLYALAHAHAIQREIGNPD